MAITTAMKNWLPSVGLLFFLVLLIAAIRIYVGGPDGIEVVWKGQLDFSDTVVNVDDYSGSPRAEMVVSKPALLSQMEDMGLFDDEDEARLRRRKRRPRKAEQTPAGSETTVPAESKAAAPN